MFGLPPATVARFLFWLAVIVLLVAGLVYFMRRLREKGEEEEAASSGDLLTSFRDIHAQGELSDDEYRAIKSRLATKVQDELRREDDTS